MKKLENAAELINNCIRKNKVEKAAFTVTDVEVSSLEMDKGEIKLLKTIHSNEIFLTLIDSGKKGFVQGNDLTEEGVEGLVSSGMEALASAEADDGNEIAEDEGFELFEFGAYEPDNDKLLMRILELKNDIKKEYKFINEIDVSASHERIKTIYNNTNGSDLRQRGGRYMINLRVSASFDGDNTNQTGENVTIDNLDTPFIELGMIRTMLEYLQKEAVKTEITDNFTGKVLLTPAVLWNFICGLIGNYANGYSVRTKTSKWLDKIGEKVVSDKLTITVDSNNKNIVFGEKITYDGYRSEKVTFIDKGVLKSYDMDLYNSRKTGYPVSKNTGGSIVVECGDISVDDMITSIDKGLIVGGFSGGEIGPSGEFSGVAKHSFYVEGGKIIGAVSEVMINGILDEMFNNILEISKETTQNGWVVIPYMLVDKVAVTGK